MTNNNKKIKNYYANVGIGKVTLDIVYMILKNVKSYRSKEYQILQQFYFTLSICSYNETLMIITLC